MADYRKMYYTLLSASEDAISTLVQAQQQCEEMDLSTPDGEIVVLNPEDSQKN